MRDVVQSRQFKKDLKKINLSGKYHFKDLKDILDFLRYDFPLAKKYRDHALVGEWQGFRECHVKPDWLLIYEKPEGLLILARTGSYSELF